MYRIIKISPSSEDGNDGYIALVFEVTPQKEKLHKEKFVIEFDDDKNTMCEIIMHCRVLGNTQTCTIRNFSNQNIYSYSCKYLLALHKQYTDCPTKTSGYEVGNLYKSLLFIKKYTLKHFNSNPSGIKLIFRKWICHENWFLKKSSILFHKI